MNINFTELYSEFDKKRLKLAEYQELKNVDEKQDNDIKDFIRRYRTQLKKNLDEGKYKRGFSLQVGSIKRILFDYFFNSLGDCKREIKLNSDNGLQINIVWTINNADWFEGKKNGPFIKVSDINVPLKNCMGSITKKMFYKTMKFSLDFDTDIVHCIWQSKCQVYDIKKKKWFDSI
jgi:hypothetical protein